MYTKNFKIVFIHGNETEHWGYFWAPWLKLELEKKGYEVIFETMPDGIKARKDMWYPHMKDVLNIDENTIIIGHSSGATAAMYYAQRHHILASVLISPCYTDLGEELEKQSGWYDEAWDWKKIKENQQKIALLYSMDDDVIPAQEFLDIKEFLEPDLVYECQDRGHFISKDEFPEALEALQRILESL